MRNSNVLLSAIVIGALIGGITMGVPSIRHRIIPHTAPVVGTASAPAATVATATSETTPEEKVSTDTTPPAASETAAAASANTITPSAGIDLKAALKERVLGNADAPVTFYDYSSLSCPHCADFHINVLPQIKRDYIDTGKVKMVFRPFPLNEPALIGEKIARCVPESEYFPMLELLFANQEKWVFGDPKSNLRQMVKVAGVTDALFDECVASKPLEEGIAAIAKQGSERFKIQGTPTFIIGEDSPQGDKLTGEASYEALSAKFDKLLTDKMIETPVKK